jgi:outer membrane protein assembly factor BamD (BamD/ComL family)
MTIGEKRALKVFLCHASGDKPQVLALYKHLVVEGVDAWLDKKKLLPGQDWRVEIPRAVRESDVVVVCLSNKSITKEGYIQKETKFALDVAEEKPDGTIFLIPARLEDCPVPEKLSRWQWVDLFEENGYVKLLSSLKLRANIVGAVITPSSFEDEDDEVKKRRLDQYYTEGLAAFYTEDWSKACHCFQLILSERPGDKNAIEKFDEAERQRDLSKLYVQSADAYQAENWQAAIKTLDELLKKSPNYKDSVELFKNAKKQRQLNDLYSEAKKLHAAKKWYAVLKVFDQIFAIDPNHPDPDGLLPSAQKEAAELKRLSGLNDLYSQSVREMALGKWYEARTLLEQVHKAQTGFLETESLLRKVEDEILKIEKISERNNQISTLYEQAHGLLRSRNWRNALDKMEEIRKLDDQFEDKDGIVEKAKVELKREEQEVQKQNQLAAMYADAVRLLKEGKYQEALDKWDEVKAIDSKYPDRQQVQRNVHRKLAEANKNKPIFYKNRPFLIGVVVILLVAIIYLLRGFLLPTDETVYLADLKPVSTKVGYSVLGVGKYPFAEGTIVQGNVLHARNGVEFPHGLFAHAPSEIEYFLPENAATFSASIYMDGYAIGEYTCGGDVIFIVLLDGITVYKSSKVDYYSSYIPIEVLVSVEGGDVLTLVTDPINDDGCDYSVWGDPYLTIK